MDQQAAGTEDVLVGREKELTALASFLEQRQSGLALVVGAPRSGKRSLLRELRRMADQRSYHVLPILEDWVAMTKELSVEDCKRQVSGVAELQRTR